MVTLAVGLHSCQAEIFAAVCCSLRFYLASLPSFSFSFMEVSPALCSNECPTSTGSLLIFSHRHLTQYISSVSYSVLLSTSEDLNEIMSSNVNSLFVKYFYLNVFEV